MTFNELLQKYVNLSYGELVDVGRSGLGKALPAVEKYFDGQDGAASFLMILIGTCLGADGELTALEASYINDVMGTKLEVAELIAATQACGDAESRELINKAIDALDSETKTALCSFCICTMSVDETISRPEVAFIAKLLA